MPYHKILPEWNYKKSKQIIDHLGFNFFHNKKILDLGCYLGDVAGSLFRLGADITCADARNEHLKMVSKKYPGIKTIKTDLDKEWVFGNYDVILSLDLLCYLKNFETHLRNICAHANCVVLETAVCDSNDPNTFIVLPEHKNAPDGSFNGFSARPTAAMIERIFTECGFEYKRIDYSRLNIGKITYDWKVSNSNSCDDNKRRFWIAQKSKTKNITSLPPAVKFEAPPAQTIVPNNSFNPMKEFFNPTPIQQPQPQPSAIDYKSGNKHFVVVIPSYNNSRWCEKNINSALSQNYDNFRIIFTDDMSSDDTFAKVQAAVSASKNAGKCTLVKNTTRKGALENLYDMIHSCHDEEIILTLDGDDWFPHDNVLNRLNEIYSDQNTWMTYGQYKNSTDSANGIAQPYPPHIIESNTFRGHVWSASHLRTFYAWLFKKIKKEDLMLDGKFFTMTWDFAIMFPMLEMSRHHSKFLADILYVYNLENPINDHKVNVQLQQSLDRHIRSMSKYSPVARPAPPKTKVGLLLVATGKYDRFVQAIITSADKFFLTDCDVSYYLFTDKIVNPTTNRRTIRVPVEHQPFPYATLNRFKFFSENKKELSGEDYIFYCDVDSLFVNPISSNEILGDLVAVQHCGFVNRRGPYETNPKSNSYVDPNKQKRYYGGGFSGGLTSKYLELAQACYDGLKKDLENGIMPTWHDESQINAYFADHEPNIVLDPGFHYPQTNINYYKGMWGKDYTSKILLLDKDHTEIRK